MALIMIDKPQKMIHVKRNVNTKNSNEKSIMSINVFKKASW